VYIVTNYKKDAMNNGKRCLLSDSIAVVLVSNNPSEIKPAQFIRPFFRWSQLWTWQEETEHRLHSFHDDDLAD